MEAGELIAGKIAVGNPTLHMEILAVAQPESSGIDDSIAQNAYCRLLSSRYT
jgi:hypothetical protein